MVNSVPPARNHCHKSPRVNSQMNTRSHRCRVDMRQNAISFRWSAFYELRAQDVGPFVVTVPETIIHHFPCPFSPLPYAMRHVAKKEHHIGLPLYIQKALRHCRNVLSNNYVNNFSICCLTISWANSIFSLTITICSFTSSILTLSLQLPLPYQQLSMSYV